MDEQTPEQTPTEEKNVLDLLKRFNEADLKTIEELGYDKPNVFFN